jgi:hypothetical protein
VEFFTLADAIDGIITAVDTGVSQEFEELERVAQGTAELASKLAKITDSQNHDTQRMLATTRTHFSKLDEGLRASEAAAHSISEAGKNITAGVETM